MESLALKRKYTESDFTNLSKFGFPPSSLIETEINVEQSNPKSMKNS